MDDGGVAPVGADADRSPVRIDASGCVRRRGVVLVFVEYKVEHADLGTDHEDRDRMHDPHVFSASNPCGRESEEWRGGEAPLRMRRV